MAAEMIRNTGCSPCLSCFIGKLVTQYSLRSACGDPATGSASTSTNVFPHERSRACQGVVEINGELYAKFEAVVRRVVGRSLTLYIPAVDRTMRLSPPSNALAEIAGSGVRFEEPVALSTVLVNGAHADIARVGV